MSQIPERKHSKDELAELRARKAMQNAGQQIVNPYDKKLVSKPVMIIGYLSALIAPIYLVILKVQDRFNYDMTDFKVMLIGTVVALLIAGFIFIGRSLSRHHASFIVIIALLSSFSIVYLVNQDTVLKREILSMMGQQLAPEETEADRIVADLLNNAESNAEERETSSTISSKPEREKIVLTPEERAEMERMFAPAENKALEKKNDN